MKGFKYPLVSVITPSFNQGAYIKETIESVLTQDYPRIEYFVMDGGSTDETVDILQQYSDQIAWVSQKDGGQAAAVNQGVAKSSGEIIGWLNSDDTYLPGAISEIVQFFQEHHEVDMVYGEGYHTDKNGVILDRYETEPFDKARLAWYCYICQPTAFFRRAFWDRVGGLNAALQICMDYELWMRMANMGQIVYLNRYLATSRMYENNKTLSRKTEGFQEAFRILKHHYEFVPLSWISSYIDYLHDIHAKIVKYIWIVVLSLKYNWYHLYKYSKDAMRFTRTWRRKKFSD